MMPTTKPIQQLTPPNIPQIKMGITTKKPSSHNQLSKEAILLNQTHSDILIEITQENKHLPHSADAMFTHEKNIVLGIKTADCLPILIANPPHLIAGIHAGRRGTDQNILQKTIQKLTPIFNNKAPLHIWFGPCLCVPCHQINREKDIHYDLIKENIKQLNTLNRPYNLYQHPSCTKCNPDIFYSYRASGPKAGRNVSWIYQY